MHNSAGVMSFSSLRGSGQFEAEAISFALEIASAYAKKQRTPGNETRQCDPWVNIKIVLKNGYHFRKNAGCPECRGAAWQCAQHPCQRQSPGIGTDHSPPLQTPWD